MANIQKIFTGMSRGPEVINDNLNAINADLQKVSGIAAGLQWTSQTKEGLVIANGVSLVGGGYSYAQIGNHKLVFLAIMLNVTGSFKEIAVQDAITVPDTIASNSVWITWLGGNTEARLDRNKILIGDTTGNTNRQWQGYTSTITLLYIV